MRLRLLAALLFVSISASTAWADELPPLAVPDGAQITLTPFKQKWLLGENILLYYEVKNTGNKPFQVDSGGDYRGGTRAYRFKVAAYDEQGKLQDDPSPFQLYMGGMGGPKEIKPGESWFGNVPLLRYRNLPQPGKYTIRIAHDLGWQGEPLETNGPQKNEAQDVKIDPRWLETTIEVAMPTEAEAAKLLLELLEQKDFGGTFGKKREPYHDLSCLRYPVYLPFLLKLSREHHMEGVIAIAHQYTPESTSALVELLFLADDAGRRHGNNTLMQERGLGSADENETISDAAAKYLCQRIPDPFLKADEQQENEFDNGYRQQRLKRIADSWRDVHAEPVRKYARHVLLNHPPSGLSDSRSLNAVALLKAVATKEDREVFIKALDDALKVKQAIESIPYSVEAQGSALHYGLLMNLQRTVNVLKFEPQENPTSSAEIVVYLAAIRRPDAKPPAEFKQLASKWLAHPIAYIRRLTLEALPRPIPDWVKPELAALMRLEDVGVRFETAQVVTAAADKQFRDVVLERMAVEQDNWVMRELQQAAEASDVPRDVILETWAKRLEDNAKSGRLQLYPVGAQCFELLKDNVIDFSGGSGWNGLGEHHHNLGLVERWLRFIDNNRKDLLAGKKFKVGDKQLTVDLFPRGAHIYHQGKQWPPRPADSDVIESPE